MVSLMTYNLGFDRKEHISSAIKTIKNESPDILVLIEVKWLVDHKAIQALSANLGFPYFYLAKSDNSSNRIALFSKFSLENASDVRGMKNAAIIATIESDLGEISIAGVHLATNTEDTRLTEIEKIVSLQKSNQNKIIIGDLNSVSPENIVKSHTLSGTKKLEIRYDVVERIKNAGYQDTALVTEKENVPTVSVTQDDDVTYYDLRLDYIFLSNSLVNRLVDYRVIVNEITNVCSDHYPVVVRIETGNRAI